MALHHDLLRQARLLAHYELKKPKQASLRRAVSADYYSLFHLFTSEAADRLVTGTDREALRAVLRRAFDHATMKEASKEIVKPNGGKLAKGMNGIAVPIALKDVAEAFVELQQARHEADYDVFRTFTRAEALDLVDMAEQAFANWHTIRKTLPADVFLTALLAYRGMCR